jgi:hypothetical protein
MERPHHYLKEKTMFFHAFMNVQQDLLVNIKVNLGCIEFKYENFLFKSGVYEIESSKVEIYKNL